MAVITGYYANLTRSVNTDTILVAVPTQMIKLDYFLMLNILLLLDLLLPRV